MLRIYLFGTLRLHQNGVDLPFNGLPRTRELLAYLLLNPDQLHKRHYVATVLWPDSAETAIRSNLRRHLHDLRKTIPHIERWLTVTNDTLLWQSDGTVWVDVTAFESLRRTPAGQPKAAALYVDDFMCNSFGDWLIPERERLRQAQIETLSKLTQGAFTQRKWLACDSFASSLLNLDPFYESIVGLQMAARYHAGDRARALETYQQFATVMAEQLGTSPADETTSLHAEIVAQTLASPADMAAPLLQIPALRNQFFGRTIELVQTIDLLTQSDVHAPRLITYTGPGGSGKTRLAIEVAQRLADRQVMLFPDGIVFVDLASATTVAQVEALLVQAVATQHTEGDLAEHLQQKHMLLIVDNLEQVLDSAELFSRLLDSAPALHVLATSRAPLQIYGEYEFSIAPLTLPPPSARVDPEQLTTYSAIAMFLDRVRAIRPNFEINRNNASAIIDLCLRLDGLPLAIELAASRVKHMSLAAILTQLKRRPDFLRNTAGDQPSRQQTLTSTILWSYNLLSETERGVFDALAVFRGGFSPRAVAAVWQGDVSAEFEALDHLTSLANQSMIRIEHNDMLHQPRFTMLVTLREFAQLRCKETGSLEALARRHADFFLHEAIEAESWQQREQSDTHLHQLNAEQHNLQRALDVITTQSDASAPDNRIQIQRILGEQRFANARYADALRLYRDMQRVAQDAGLSRHEVDAWQRIGFALQRLGNLADARAAASRAVQVADAIKQTHPAIHYLALYTLGWMLYEMAAHAESLTIANQSLALANLHADELHKARSLNLIGCIYRQIGRFNASVNALHQSAQHYRDGGSPLGAAIIIYNLSQTRFRQGHFALAAEHLNESETMLMSLEHQDMHNPIQLAKAEMALAEGQTERAIDLLTLLVSDADKRPRMLDRIHITLAEACLKTGAHQVGWHSLLTAHRVTNNDELTETKGHCWRVTGLYLAQTAYRLDDTTIESAFERAAQLFARASMPREEGLTRWQWAESGAESQREMALALLHKHDLMHLAHTA